MSACDQCDGRGIYHPLGSQEYRACYLCDGPSGERVESMPTASPLEAAWAEVGALEIEKVKARTVAEKANVDYNRIYDQRTSALLRAIAIGPRPAKVPT